MRNDVLLSSLGLSGVVAVPGHPGDVRELRRRLKAPASHE